MKAFAAVAGLALVLSAGAQARTAQPALNKIGHILVVFEENRSFDNLFGHFPGANGLDNAGQAAPQTGRDGVVLTALPTIADKRFAAPLPNAPFNIEPFVPETGFTSDIVHRFYQEQGQIDGGKMDRFAAISDAGGLAMGYFEPKDSRLWKLAREFALGDAMFHSAFGGSFLNHSFLVCSCAFRWPNAPEKVVAKLDAAGHMAADGKVTPDGDAVNTARSVYLHMPEETAPAELVPPQTMAHIGDRLDAKHVDWAWYAGGYADASGGHPDKLFQYHHQPFAYFADLAPGTPGQEMHLKDAKDLDAAIAAGKLPPVAFYKPFATFNQHPGYANIADGDAHLGDLIARLRASKLWKDTLVIVTYDENGGQWDHVAPPQRDAWGPGTRVPLLLIGPMVKPHFIDHTSYDFGSILRTIELRFGAEPLNARDAKATPMTAALQ